MIIHKRDLIKQYWRQILCIVLGFITFETVLFSPPLATGIILYAFGKGITWGIRLLRKQPIEKQVIVQEMKKICSWTLVIIAWILSYRVKVYLGEKSLADLITAANAHILSTGIPPKEVSDFPENIVTRYGLSGESGSLHIKRCPNIIKICDYSVDDKNNFSVTFLTFYLMRHTYSHKTQKWRSWD